MRKSLLLALTLSFVFVGTAQAQAMFDKEAEIDRLELEIADNAECVQLMADFIATRPELWNEDIGK